MMTDLEVFLKNDVPSKFNSIQLDKNTVFLLTGFTECDVSEN